PWSSSSRPYVSVPSWPALAATKRAAPSKGHYRVQISRVGSAVGALEPRLTLPQQLESAFIPSCRSAASPTFLPSPIPRSRSHHPAPRPRQKGHDHGETGHEYRYGIPLTSPSTDGPRRRQSPQSTPHCLPSARA